MAAGGEKLPGWGQCTAVQPPLAAHKPGVVAAVWEIIFRSVPSLSSAAVCSE